MIDYALKAKVEQLTNNTLMIGVLNTPPTPHLTYWLLNLEHRLQGFLEHRIVDTVISYTSLLVSINLATTTVTELLKHLPELIRQTPDTPALGSTTHSIPVYYSMESGPDLDHLARYSQLTVEEVIELHHSQPYFVYATGFMPGFTFMGFVSEKIAMPRKPKPIQQVPKGSVGIAEKQTGVYPHQSPGGWQLIGQTPLDLSPKIDALNNETPFSTTIKIGDTVAFYPISKEQFYEQFKP